MGFSIRNARREDMGQVLALIQELAVFEKDPDAVEVTKEDLINDGFGKNKQFHCFVAEKEGNIVGMALIYHRYSTWKGPTVHLEDLIVSQRMRGSGLGTALLDQVIKYGHNRGVKRISWEVLDWNEPAIKFYEKKGARVRRDWDVVQLDEEGIKEYITRIN